MTQFVTPVPQAPQAAPRKDVANIFFILDKSGSMSSMKSQAITGFNQFVASQRNLPGATRITLVQFDDKREVCYESVDVNSVPELDGSTYVPDGYTALNDSVGFVLSNNIPKCPADETNIVAILTDGAENASKEYSLEQVKSLLTQAQEAGWEVLFLGANMQKASVVSTYGLDASNVSTFQATAKGATDAFTSLSAATSSYRGLKSMGALRSRVDMDAVYASSTAGVSAEDMVNSVVKSAVDALKPSSTAPTKP